MNTCPKTILVALLSLVSPSVGHTSVRAQAVPHPGELVRLWDVDGTLYVGPLISMSADEIRLVDQTDQTEYTIPRDQIATFEQRIVRRHFARHLLLTSTGVTLGTAVAMWAVVETLCQGLCSGHDSFSLGVGARLGATIGVPLGVVVGLVAKERGWSPVAVPKSEGSRLSVLPIVGDRRLGLAGSVSLPRW